MNKRTPPVPFQYKYLYTQSDKTIVRKDWAALLPDMLPMRKGRTIKPSFQRRVGPLLIRLGYIFSRGSTDYEPSYWAVNLAYECIERGQNFTSSAIYFNPEHPYMYIGDHIAKHVKAFESLKNKAVVPLNGPVTLDDIFNGYSKPIIDKGELANLSYFSVVGTPALVAAWAGEPEKAMEYLEWACEALYESDSPLGTKTEFRKFHENLIQNPEILRSVADKNLETGDGLNYWPQYMAQAPYQDIVGARYQKLKK